MPTFEDKYTEALLKQGGGARRQKSASRGSAASGASPRAAALGLDVAVKVASQGAIFNPSSGRNIKIGGDTYMRLLEAGWSPDLARGVMVEPQGGGSPVGSRGGVVVARPRGGNKGRAVE